MTRRTAVRLGVVSILVAVTGIAGLSAQFRVRSGVPFAVNRVIGGRAAHCEPWVHTFAKRMWLDRVSLDIDDNVRHHAGAAVQVYVDGKPVGPPQKVSKAGGSLDFPLAVEGQSISFVARHEDWTPAKGGRSEDARIGKVTIFFSDSGKGRTILAQQFYRAHDLILGGKDERGRRRSAVHTIILDRAQPIGRIAVFAGDGFGDSAMAALACRIDGKLIGSVKNVARAGDWLIFEANGTIGRTITFETRAEKSGAVGGDETILYNILVFDR